MRATAAALIQFNCLSFVPVISFEERNRVKQQAHFSIGFLLLTTKKPILNRYSCTILKLS